MSDLRALSSAGFDDDISEDLRGLQRVVARWWVID